MNTPRLINPPRISITIPGAISIALFTYNLSAFNGGDFTWGQDPPDSELRRMSNNTLHWDWLALGWAIDNVGHYYPDGLGNSSWWECDDNSDYYYLENIDEFTPAVFEKTLEHATFVSGMTLCEIYGHELYPEAVQHCAGLLEFFASSVGLNPQREAIAKGISWLRSHQYANGSWLNDPAVTSMAVLTMLNWDYDESDSVVSDGIAYIRSYINPDGSVYSNIARSTYYTSIAILPLVATHNSSYESEIERMREWLIDLQWDESCIYGGVNTSSWYYGGWGYGSSGRPDLSNTQWAIMGLKAADNELGLTAVSTYNKCADWFLARCRNADGGSAYTPGDSSIHTMTAASVWSYALCGRGSSAEAAGGIQWLTDHYSLTNNDGWGYWSEYYYKVTLAKALTMTHKTMLGTHDWYAELSQKLIDEQYAGGNWPDTGMMGSEMSTAWAIMALQSRTLPPSGDLSMWMELESHCDLHVYDPQGRHMGLDYDM